MDAGNSGLKNSQQQNRNSSLCNNNNINNINNNTSENVVDYNDQPEVNHRDNASGGLHVTGRDQGVISPSNASHFAPGSGVLSDTLPARPARRQYMQKSK